MNSRHPRTATGILVLSLCLASFACGPPSANPGHKPSDPEVKATAFSAQTTIQTTINSKPSNPSSSRTAKFTFSCNQSPCRFKCFLDAGAGHRNTGGSYRP